MCSEEEVCALLQEVLNQPTSGAIKGHRVNQSDILASHQLALDDDAFADIHTAVIAGSTVPLSVPMPVQAPHALSSMDINTAISAVEHSPSVPESHPALSLLPSPDLSPPHISTQFPQFPQPTEQHQQQQQLPAQQQLPQQQQQRPNETSLTANNTSTQPQPPRRRPRGRRTSANSVIECPECQQLYSRPDNLRAHMRMHNGDRPFQCRNCGESFKWLSTLRSHEEKSRKCRRDSPSSGGGSGGAGGGAGRGGGSGDGGGGSGGGSSSSGTGNSTGAAVGTGSGSERGRGRTKRASGRRQNAVTSGEITGAGDPTDQWASWSPRIIQQQKAVDSVRSPVPGGSVNNAVVLSAPWNALSCVFEDAGGMEL